MLSLIVFTVHFATTPVPIPKAHPWDNENRSPKPKAAETKKQEPLPWIFPPPAPVDESQDDEVFKEDLGY